MSKKIIFAVGGTGGHLFPAQALARELKEQQSQLEILFGGGRLGSNQFFHKLKFPFREISSGSPLRSNPIKAVLQIGQGVRESIDLINDFSPDLVIGFGSFYSFPLLMASRIKKIPYILVESNTFPGKVNRLFSSKALVSAIQFPEAAQVLKGKTVSTKMPFWSQELNQVSLHPSEARKYYQLDPSIFTLLVFGGSQGAAAINQAVANLELDIPFQVLHFCGKAQDPSLLVKRYEERGIVACVKSFEDRMHVAWRAADLVICRAGAATLAEIEAFQVPAILIPWPGASDQHQHKNARVMEKLGGALFLEESNLKVLASKVKKAKEKLPEMEASLQAYSEKETDSLHKIVLNQLESLL